MSCYQRSQVRRQLMLALRAAGGSAMTVTRRAADANGVPTGETLTVCTLFGLRYHRDGRALALRLDMPGVIAADTDSPRVIAVMTSGGLPHTGDMLDGSTTILSVDESMGAVYLTLGGDGA